MINGATTLWNVTIPFHNYSKLLQGTASFFTDLVLLWVLVLLCIHENNCICFYHQFYYHSRTHKVNFCPILTFKTVWPNKVYTQYLPMFCDDKISRELPILMLVSFVNLACTAVFDMWLDGTSHTFPMHCWMLCLFKTGVSRMLQVVVISANCWVLKNIGDDHLAILA
jgi:hypothetical protein